MSEPQIDFPPIPNGKPSTSSEWAKDPRIAYSQITNKWIFEDKSGKEYEYNEDVRNWIPVLSEEDLKSQQQAYQGSLKRPVEEIEEDGQVDSKIESRSDRNGDRKPDLENKKEDDADFDDEVERTQNRVRGTKQNKKLKTEEQANHHHKKPTSIYLSNLPYDVTYEELDYTFSKYGVIAEDLNTGQKKIKIYKDSNGKVKGDALIVYFKPESAPLAIEMMNNSELRPGEPGRNQNGKIQVQKAEFNNNKHIDEKPKLNAKEKFKIQKKLQKLNNKLADWDDDEPKEIPKRWEKVIVLKNVFTLKELEEDSTAAYDIKQDIMEGCEDIGQVSNVTLYDLESDGIVTVKFLNRDDALLCVQRMNGRYFGGKQLEAFMYDGKIKFRKTKDDNDEDEEQRLEDYSKWLDKGS